MLNSRRQAVLHADILTFLRTALSTAGFARIAQDPEDCHLLSGWGPCGSSISSSAGTALKPLQPGLPPLVVDLVRRLLKRAVDQADPGFHAEDCWLV